MEIKIKRKKRKWDWLVDLLDAADFIWQILWGAIRGITYLIHLTIKILEQTLTQLIETRSL